MVAGYLPETVGNLYQGKHFHAKLVLNAYQMDVTDVSDPDDAEIDSLDRDDLQKLYDKMEPLEQAGGENFLPDAWEKFEDAFNKAESVLKDEDATEDEILDAFLWFDGQRPQFGKFGCLSNGHSGCGDRKSRSSQ